MESKWLKPLTASELPRLLETNKVVVVHCWALWNGYDRQFRAAVRSLEPAFGESVDFYALDTRMTARYFVELGKFEGTRFETMIGFSDQPYEQQIREVLDRWTRRNETKPRFD
jgi:hypothetical protein